MTERSNVPVLKTGDGVTHPRVQISPPPPFLFPESLCHMVDVLHSLLA